MYRIFIGGRMDMFQLSPEKAIAGIFIKNVLEESPAGRSGQLKTGDRILQVGVTVCGAYLWLCLGQVLASSPVFGFGPLWPMATCQ